jgi:hypothetical protein
MNTDNNLFGDDGFSDYDDDDFEENEQIDNCDPLLFDNDTVIPDTQGTSANGVLPQDFEGVDPDYIMHRMKLIWPDIITLLKMKPFYKSYTSWQKLSADQKNKTVSFIRKLPTPLRGTDAFLADCSIRQNFFLITLSFFSLGNIINRAREDSLEAAQKEVSISSQNTKDDIAVYCMQSLMLENLQ